MNKALLNQLDIGEMIPEDDLDNLAELLNYPLREHKRIIEQHTDREVEIRTFTGATLKELFTELGFEQGMEKVARLIKEEIDDGHGELEEVLAECSSATQP